MINKLKEIENRYRSESPYQYNSNYVPRVTEILSSMLHEDVLMEWSNNIGLRGLKYHALLNAAAEKGTYTHLAIEKFLNKEEFDISTIPEYSRKAVNNAFASFHKWYDPIQNNIVPLYTEKQLICPYFGGTADIIIKSNDNIYLGDFKTSNHVKYNYFLQLAAYKFILENYYDIKLNGCFVLQLNKYSINYNEYILDFSIEEHQSYINTCTETFLSLVYAYYKRLETQEGFEKLFN